MRVAIILSALLAFSGGHAEVSSVPSSRTTKIAAAPENSTPAPQWYLDDIAFLTRDGGRWSASNADYVGENEPMESYVLEWRVGYANSMTGRLFAIVDGKETGDFWRFRQYWHAGEGKAVLEQFGYGGAIGVGVIWREGEKIKTAQTFYPPEGAPQMQGHIAYNPDAATHVTESYNIVDGEWQANRTYTWKHEPPANEG